MTAPVCWRVGEITVEGDGHVFVAADAILDGLGVLLAMDERLPRVDVLGLVKIAVGDERQPLEPDVVEDVIAIGDFPGIEQGAKVPDFPRDTACSCPHPLFMMCGAKPPPGRLARGFFR